jgi:hypothetical protein
MSHCLSVELSAVRRLHPRFRRVIDAAAAHLVGHPVVACLVLPLLAEPCGKLQEEETKISQCD